MHLFEVGEVEPEIPTLLHKLNFKTEGAQRPPGVAKASLGAARTS